MRVGTEAKRRGGRWCIACVAGVGAMGLAAAQAQVRPDAGQTLESIRPAPAVPEKDRGSALPTEPERPALSTPGEQRIPVRAIQITGARAIAQSELLPLVQDAIGRDLTLDELNALARRITQAYRARGYLLSRAYLPAQDVSSGRIEIAVLEGRLDRVTLQNDSRLRNAQAEAFLAPLHAGAAALQGSALERSLLLLDDVPGAAVSSTLKPGGAVGAADLDVRLRDTPLLSGSVEADNTGNRYTGEYRLGGTLEINNPSRFGDLLTLRLIDSGPGLQYARGAWLLPLGGSGLKAGLAWSSLRYRLGRDFETLGAHGSADVGSAWALYPLLRSQNRNLNLQVSYDAKRLVDLVDASASNSTKKLRVWTLGLSGDHSDDFFGGGASLYSASLVSGRLGLDPVTQALDQGPGGHNTGGGYTKLAYSYVRLQRLGGPFSLYLNLTGQAAGKTLDSSEKLSLGGAYGVRAYPQGEAAGDSAAVLNLELRWALPAARELQAVAFVDAGAARINQNALATDSNNRRHLLGEGLGLQWQRYADFSLKAYVAWRAGARPVSDSDRNPRLWVMAAKSF